MRTISVCTLPEMVHSKPVTDSIAENAWLHQMRRVAWVLLLILVVLSVSVVLPVRSLPAVTGNLHPQERGIVEAVNYALSLIPLFRVAAVIAPAVISLSGPAFCLGKVELVWPVMARGLP